jgi:hypothetical protein
LTPKTWWAGGWAKRDFAIGGTALGLLVALTLAGSSLAGLVVVAVAAALIGVLRLRNVFGEAAADRYGGRLARLLVGWAGLNEHDQSPGGPPAVLGETRLIDVAVGGGRTLWLVEHAGGREDETSWTAVVEIDGEAVGEADQTAEDRRAGRFERFLTAVCRADLPVDQVDVVTRVAPDKMGDYAEWAALVSAAASPAAGAELRLRGPMVGERSSRVGSWLAVRMPLAALRRADRRAGGDGGLGDLGDAAARAVDQVVRAAADNGLAPRRLVTRDLLAGVLRSWLDPGHDWDDLSGLTTDLWEAVPSFRPAGAGFSALAARSAGGTAWAHAAGFVGGGQWPPEPVGGDFLRGLVTSLWEAPVRTVVAQFATVPAHRARGIARSLTAGAAAAQRRESKRGRVSTGEEGVKESAATALLGDLTRGSVGVLRGLRVLVSSPSLSGLWDARQGVERAVPGLGWTWCDGDHARGLVNCLPLARGLRRPREAR